MSKYKVLYVVHNHPTVRPGGAEAYALELYEVMRSSDEFEPIMMARTGPPMSKSAQNHPGTVFTSVNEDPNQYFIFTDAANFDWFYGTPRRKEIFTEHYHRFLESYKPDVVHFQHTLHLGYDIILQTRRTLPDSRIVYTLHEYLPVCHRDGQMLRTQNDELCNQSSPRRCHECFPEILPQAFFMRQRFIQSHFSLVDLFIAPSRFLLERYVEWGIPRTKIQYEEYGRQSARPIPAGEGRQVRNRIGFFGQVNPFKGTHVLLKAMEILADESSRRLVSGNRGSPNDIHAWLHGANLDLQTMNFQENLKVLLGTIRGYVTFVGPYVRDDLPALMANIDWVVVPSIWWENSPLVIQEAFQHGRPVICSGIGGMAEKVAHGINGLHFRVGDPVDLAQAIRYATGTPGLWERLCAGIPDVYPMHEHVTKLTRIYKDLLQNRPASGSVRDSGSTIATSAIS